MEDAEKSAAEAEKNKPFSELLENPTKIEDLKLTLSNGSEITFDKNDNTINFGGEKFGVIGAMKLLLDNHLKDNPFSFKSIFNNNENKNKFIKVLNDLKIKKSSKYGGMKFEKIA